MAYAVRSLQSRWSGNALVYVYDGSVSDIFLQFYGQKGMVEGGNDQENWPEMCETDGFGFLKEFSLPVL